MYGHADMQESELYFALLQLLRFFSLSIDETIHYLEDRIKTWSYHLEHYTQRTPPTDFNPMTHWEKPVIDADGFKTIQKNWEDVREHFNLAANTIRKQIRQKEDVIQSLRSGVRVEAYPPTPPCFPEQRTTQEKQILTPMQLFNAITVREAVRSTELNERSSQINERSSQINQRLLVFTVVTIIFLPPTFVSVTAPPPNPTCSMSPMNHADSTHQSQPDLLRDGPL